MEVLIAVAGVLVMIMVVAGMVLLTPSGTGPFWAAASMTGASGRGPAGGT